MDNVDFEQVEEHELPLVGNGDPVEGMKLTCCIFF